MEANPNAYDIAYEKATNPETREKYWAEYAERVEWFDKPSKILDESNPPFYRWFKDGKINICRNAVDRWAEVQPNNPAIIWESNMEHRSCVYTFQQVLEKVSKLATVLLKLGVKIGDRVIIYMPMIPEALFSMLACARIGAIHSVVFGGFAAKELASRIQDAQPKLIICASCGLEPHKIVCYKTIIDEALKILNNDTLKTIIVQRDIKRTDRIRIGHDFDYYSLMETVEPLTECVPVNGDHPLYILYTSGTTGQPKGICRDQGGTAVALTWTMTHIMGIGKGDTYFSGSDIGWVVGHSFTTYGPLLVGATTVVYEGKPTGTPDPGAYWRIIEKHNVNGFYTAPTALRALRKEDPNGEYIKKYITKSLRAVSMAGERCDIPTFEWISSNLPNVLINDNYWQTETGWIISCNFKDLHTFPMKPGSCIKPSPGFVVHIKDENNETLPLGSLGRLCIKLPLPPSFMLTLWNNDQAFIEKYLKDTPGYYVSGDAGYFDENGLLHVMTRLDDIINTAGHRLSTAQMEEVILGHHDIVEAAVVAAKEELKGEVPVGFVVIKAGHTPDPRILQKELVQKIRDEIGPVASFRYVIILDKLPKTRSGKILRGTLKKMVNGVEYKVPATIEDESVLPKIEKAIKENGLGLGVNLIYEEDCANTVVRRIKEDDD